MTQASLSPDLHGTRDASSPVREGTTSDPSLDATLWMIALTSTSLVVASLLLLGLLMRSVITDAALGGFVSGVGIIIATIGVGGVSYSLVTARRAWTIAVPEAAGSASAAVPPGMHVVPALPPDTGRRGRQRLEQERATRARQAQAIAAAGAAESTNARPLPARQQPSPEPEQRTGAATPPLLTLPPETRKQMAPSSTETKPTARPPMMPQAQARRPRPAAWPNRTPAVRMPPPPLRQRTQVAAFQVQAAHIRTAPRARSVVPVPHAPARQPVAPVRPVQRTPAVSRQVR